MATTVNITTSYAGESAGKYISASLLSSNTINNGGIEVKQNVKFKEIIKKLSTSDLLADASCDFTATSTVTTVERVLQPKEMQVNLEVCKTSFQSDWEAISMGYSAFDNLPPTFQDYFIGHILAKVAEKNEQNIWNGDGAVSGEFDGFATLLALDVNLPAAQEITGVAITAANVVEELGKIVDAIPDSLYGKEGLHIYISQNIYRAYVRALGGFAANGVGANGFDGKGNNQAIPALLFDGVKLFVANGLPSNTAIASEKENLYFGTGLLSDTQEVKILDMADIDGSKNVRFIARFTAGVQYGAVEDIVTYGIVNAVN